MARITFEERRALLALHSCYEEESSSNKEAWLIKRISDDRFIVLWGWTEPVEFYLRGLPEQIARKVE